MTSHKLHKAKILSKTLLTKKGSIKKTYHIVFSKEKTISFQPGDCVAIIPKNDPQKVSSIIKSLKAKNGFIFYKRKNKTYPLKYFFENIADIKKISSSLLKYLYENGNKKLKPIIENKESLTSFLKNHELWDLLDQYLEKNITPQELSDFLLPLIPRFYSISSSPSFYKNEIHITVTLVSYKTSGYERYGTTTNYLCNMSKKNSVIDFYIQPTDHFFLQKKAPIIMIAAGSGIAPFMSFIQERYFMKNKDNWLFFGECNRKYDFYYEDFLMKLKKENFLKLDLAFSRDQKEKIYVQHKILEKAEEFYDWIENKKAYLYVCGSAKKMARDVDAVLQDIFQKKDGINYLSDMIKEKRYLKDIY